MSLSSTAASELPSVPASLSRRQLAMADLRETARLWRMGVLLGWLDIKLRYRGSALGPFWLTVTFVFMIASMGVLYSTLFHTELSTYLPFLSVSLALWQTGLASLVQESCTCFLEAETMIRSIKLPLMLQGVRMVTRNVIVFAHNAPVPLCIFAFMKVWPGKVALLALPGFLLWGIDALAACMLLGALCARFRDVPPIVGSVMQIVFYVTPIIWMPHQMGQHATLLALNPFYDLLEIVRAPLLGRLPSLTIWAMALGTSLLLCIVGFTVFIRSRARLIFWI